jgi:hypothetical protein
MLADVSLLLHEINDAVRIRRGARTTCTVQERSLTLPATVFVTGVASSGKARLIDALHGRLAPRQIDVRAGQPPSPKGASLHVHAETDIEALIEGGLKAVSREDARHADVIVPVDWESVDRSVSRVLSALADRGADLEAGV